jgi:integration host factor subunit alpha
MVSQEGWSCFIKAHFQWGVMTKIDLIKIIHGKIGLGTKESSDFVAQVFEIIKEALESEKKVKISGFGNFIVYEKGPRKGRNPQTGDPIIISGRRVVTFKRSHILRNSLNRPGTE